MLSNIKWSVRHYVQTNKKNGFICLYSYVCIYIGVDELEEKDLEGARGMERKGENNIITF